MADAKKVTLLNRGKRHFDLGPGRRVSPGEMIEVSAEEAEALAPYRELADVSKLPLKGADAADKAKLKAANDALVAENAKLKEQLASSGAGADKPKK